MPTPKAIILSEAMRGKTYELTRELYNIGRTSANHLCIPHPTISNHHCDLIKSGNNYIARDLNSTNGTRVNGIKITEQCLYNSDILQVGSIEILFDCEDSATTKSISTQTSIDLEKSTGQFTTSVMSNIDPTRSATTGHSKSNKPKIFFTTTLVVLIITVLVLLFFLYRKLV